MGISEIDWSKVKRILVVKLRSIGDTVLATPSLIALRRFVPDAQIDILLEAWVAPLLQGHDAIDNVISVGKRTSARLKTALDLWGSDYDVAFNLHGGTTATFFTAASRAKHRVGFASYQYPFLYNHLLLSASDFWQTEFTHSAEQQLALLGFVGVPVEDRPKSRLRVRAEMEEDTELLLHNYGVDEERIALVHPASAFKTKQWAPENFAKTIDYLWSQGIFSLVVTAPNERSIIEEINSLTKTMFHGFWDLTLPQLTSLAKRAEIFVGNDSGIAHIAAAVGTPSVVVFGSSNRNHWRPWTDAPNEIVFREFACQPCPGYECKEFGEPRCIQTVPHDSVFSALKRLLS
ncbi:MAG: glycosyltransferase family 9 protein [Pyrinomonadaceae bacterium]